MSVKYPRTSKVLAPVIATGALFCGGVEATSMERSAKPGLPAVTGIKSLENMNLRYRIPRLPQNVTRVQAQQLAKKRGLRVRGDRPDCVPDQQKYCQVDGFARKTTITKSIGDRIVKKTVYKKLKPGTKLSPKIPLFLTHHKAERPYLTEAQLQAKAMEFLLKNTVHIELLGCSGTLIRDEAGTPIGVSTAQHCGLTTRAVTRQLDEQGAKFIDLPNSVSVSLGVNHEKMVGVATSAILPKEGLDADGALLVLGNNQSQKVISNYQRQQINPSDIMPQETVYAASYPLAQPKNSAQLRLQYMDMTNLGPFSIFTTLGQTLNTQAFGMRENLDGAVCSFGASGSSYVLAKETQTHHLNIKLGGVLSGYDDFRGSESNTVGYDGPAVEMERLTAMGRPDIAGLYQSFCYFTQINPSLTTDYELVTIK